MRCLDPSVVDAVWHATEAYVPPGPDPSNHPLGCHRARTPDRVCFFGMLIRLVTGCSWATAGRLSGSSASALRRRRDEWQHAAVFTRLFTEALASYDRIVGLDLSEVAVDGSIHKAPCGGEGTGRSPVDRGKRGWKWSVVADARGVPLAWVSDGANRRDDQLLEPTLRVLGARGLLEEVETLHLDRGYDSHAVRRLLEGLGVEAVIAKRGKKGPHRLGLRWPVEATNSWLSNYGQLRRNTDRRPVHRDSAIAFTCALVLAVKLVAWVRRWGR